jgi:hypothetical protein
MIIHLYFCSSSHVPVVFELTFSTVHHIVKCIPAGRVSQSHTSKTSLYLEPFYCSYNTTFDHCPVYSILIFSYDLFTVIDPIKIIVME